MPETDQFWIKFGEKLANLDHMPGVEMPGTEDLWNRLQLRFQKDKRRRRMYRYGIAASFTILFSVLLSLSINKNSSVPEYNSTNAEVVQARPIAIILPEKSRLIKSAIPKNAISKTTTEQPTKKKIHRTLSLPEPARLARPAPEMVIQVRAPEITAPVAPMAAIASPSTKHRLPIIHIKDWNAYRSSILGNPQFKMDRLVFKKDATAIQSSTPGNKGHLLNTN